MGAIRIDERGCCARSAAERVYTFAPYHDGFSAESLATNPLRVTAVEWSPNGQMLAFIIDSDDPAANDGLWFWQPARDIPTDPSYHLLRDCPPGCGMTERRNVEEWRSVSLEWSSDNQAILLRLNSRRWRRRALPSARRRDPETR
jgi:hypothetical protein